MVTNKTPTFDFEAALKELSKLVEDMEKGGDTLEVSLEKFERGMMLSRQCQEALKNAEQKVDMLLEKNGITSVTPYIDEEGDEL